MTDVSELATLGDSVGDEVDTIEYLVDNLSAHQDASAHRPTQKTERLDSGEVETLGRDAWDSTTSSGTRPLRAD